MATKRDYYEILGVQRSSDKSELKRAHRRLARQYHPDVNGEPDAEERFKEIQEAYDVLSNDDLRARYDRFGHAGVQNGGGGFSGFEGAGFGSVADIFEEFFGSAFSGGRRRRSGPRRGADLRYDLTITFEEAVFGVEKDIKIRRMAACEVCQGTGAEPDTKPITCTTCNGSGEVRRVQQSILGQFVNVTSCSTCQGSGELIPHPCHNCEGRKQVQVTVNKKIKIPAGVDNEMQIRLSEEGGPGTSGGPAGNLYVIIYVQKHEFFQRRGNDIWLDLEINVAQAALGDDVTIPTVDGEATLTIVPGTQSGKVYRLRNRGVPRLDRSGRGTYAGRGDQNIIIQVAVPRKLSDEQKDLFQQLSKTLGKEVVPQADKGIIGQLKGAFGELFD